MSLSLYETIQNTIHQFVSSYEEAVRLNEPSLLSKVVTADCTRSTAPESLLRSIGMDPTVVMDNKAYALHMTPQLSALEDGNCVILSSVVDTTRKSAVARVEHHCKIRDHDWTCLEFCWFIDFTDDGKSICKIVEFVDSRGIIDYMQTLEKLGKH